MAIYEEALRLQQKGHMDEAKTKYEELIDHKYLKKEAKNVIKYARACKVDCFNMTLDEKHKQQE